MSFAEIHWLWLAAALPVLWLLQRWWWWREHRLRARVGMRSPRLTTSQAPWRRRLRAFWWWAGLLALVVAVAQPRMGSHEEEREETGITIMVLLDCSYSMLAEDLYPTRIQSAHFKIDDLLQLRPGSRVGLLPFAGIAALRSPPTTDHVALATMLRDCTPELFEQQQQGTAIGVAVTRAVTALRGSADGGQAILILSDGDDPDQEAVAAAGTEAAKAGIPIYGLVMGDPEVATTLSIKDRQQRMPVQRSTMDSLSQASGGRTVYASNDESDLQALLGHMHNQVQAVNYKRVHHQVAAERYQVPLAVALLLLALAALWPSAKRAARAAPGVVRMVLLAALLPWSLTAGEGPWLRLDGALQQQEASPQEAAEALRLLLRDHPDFLPAHYNRALLLRDSNREAAREHLLRAIDSPDPALAAAAWYHLARLRHRSGQHQSALRAAEQARDLQPQNPAYQAGYQALQRYLLRLKELERLADEAAAARLRLNQQRLSGARQGEPFSGQLTAAGGSGGGYRFSVDEEAAQALPPGLRLDASGQVRGVPEVSGRHYLQVEVRDADGASASGRVVMSIKEALVVANTALPVAIVDHTYEVELRARGAEHPQWSTSELPAGLTLQQRGGQAVIAGVPQEAGAHRITLRLRDRDGAQAQAQLDLTVGTTFAPDRSQLTPATRDHPYRERIGVRGPDDRYHWRSPGAGGLELDADGRIHGVPEQAGVIDLPLTLVNSDGLEETASLRTVVNEPPQLPLPTEIVVYLGQPLRESLAVMAGTAPYRYELVAGPLPPGVELSEQGVLSGAAQEEGRYPLEVILSDRWQAEDRAATTMVVQPRPQEDEEPEEQDGEDDSDGDEGEEGDPQDGDSGEEGEPQDGDGEESQDSESQDGEGEPQDGNGDDGQEGESQDDGQQDPDQPGDKDDSDNSESEGEGQASEEDNDQSSPESSDSGSDASAAEDEPERKRRTPSLREADARRWLDQVLGSQRGDEQQALRRFLRERSDGEGSTEQPW